MRRHTAWLVIQLVLAVGLALFFAVLTLAGVLLGTRGQPGTSLGESITTATVGVVLGGLCIWWAMHVEHRLRGRAHRRRGRASRKRLAAWEQLVEAEFALSSRYGFEPLAADSSYWETSVIYGKGDVGLKIARSTEERCVEVHLIRLVDGKVPPYPIWITGDRIDWVAAAAVLKARNSPLLAELPPGGLSDREVAAQLRFWAHALPQAVPDFLAGDTGCIDEAAALIRETARPGAQTLTISLPDTASDAEVAAAREQASTGLPAEVTVLAQRYGTRPKRRRRRERSPRTVAILGTFALVVLTGVVVGLWAATISQHGAASRSARVQNHGIPETGTVTHVQNDQHTGRGGGSWYTARIDVRIADPATNPTTTVVHYPHRSKLHAGDTMHVLIDPHNPRYAELPGAPSATTSTWVGPLVIATIATLGLALLGYAVVRQLRHLLTRPGTPATTTRQH